MDALLADLSSRLPELEWKISNLSAFSVQALPPGLFRTRLGLTAKDCISEIKSDIHALSQQKNAVRASFIAQRIQQKINVLVSVCQIQARRGKPEETIPFSLDKLSTRQQWIQDLEQEIHTLTLQLQAMEKSLKQMKSTSQAEAILLVQTELGEINKRLTLATERLNQVISS